jgi:hypothetical protein
MNSFRLKQMIFFLVDPSKLRRSGRIARSGRSLLSELAQRGQRQGLHQELLVEHPIPILTTIRLKEPTRSIYEVSRIHSRSASQTSDLEMLTEHAHLDFPPTICARSMPFKSGLLISR